MISIDFLANRTPWKSYDDLNSISTHVAAPLWFPEPKGLDSKCLKVPTPKCLVRFFVITPGTSRYWSAIQKVLYTTGAQHATPLCTFQHLPTSSNIHIKSANLSDAAFFRRPPGLGLASALAPWPAAPTRGAVLGVSGVSGVILSHSCHLKILWKVWWGEQHCTIGLIKLINEISTAEPIWAYSIWAWSNLHNFHMEHFASFLPLKYESNHCSIMFKRLCTNQVWQNPTLSNLCHWSTSTLDVKPRKAKRQMDIDDKAVQREKHTRRVSNFAKLWCRN